MLKCIWLVIFLRNNPICKIGILFNVIAINDAKEFCLGCFILSLIMTLSFTKKESEWVSGIGVLITMQTYPKLGEGGAKLPKTPWVYMIDPKSSIIASVTLFNFIFAQNDK